MSEQLETPVDERERALRAIKARRDLAGHAVSYVLFNTVVWVAWALTSSGYPWPAWLTGLWGIGLAMNAWDVYMRPPVTEADVQREIHRLRTRHGQ
ncbi:MAG TPA: 2TM domain-containing protein [Solirubrobacteraceae bacterium]|nr:2TM domain-containing protein [Solirubrobacteraceae bacterium]